MDTFAPYPFDFFSPQGQRVDLDSFSDFVRVVDDHSRQHGAAWRGQVDSTWRLTSSAFVAERNRIRLYADSNHLGEHADHIVTISHNVEERMKDSGRELQRALGTDPHLRLLFRRELTNSSIHDNPARYAEMLSIGQHFGMKTPLLDMTDSPYVALYFAAYGAMERSQSWRREERFTVWKVPAYLWNPRPEKRRFDYLMIPGLDAKELAKSQSELINMRSEDLPEDAMRINITNVFPRIYRNDRLVAQRGSFVRVTPDLPLDHVIAMMGSYWDDGVFEPMGKTLTQYTLPAHLALDCLTHLDKMNIRPGTLFPDMVGQMSSINLEMDHYDYAGKTDRYRTGTAFDVSGRRRSDFYP